MIAIDLGSNSIRVLKYNCKKDLFVGEYSQTVSTADGLKQTQNISKSALKRIVNAIKNSITKLSYNPKKAVAYTTAALRLAKNSKESLEYIYRKTGVKFKIIDAQKEAYLTLYAVKTALKRHNLYQNRFITVDIGGGSSEIIIHNKSNIKIKSFDIGLVTLTQTSKKEKEIVLKEFRKSIAKFVSSIDTDKYILISTAGTPTTIASLKLGLKYKEYDKNKINATVITQQDIKHYKDFIYKLSIEEKEIYIGQDRDRFVDAGFDILSIIYEMLSKESSIVFDDGLREGIAYNHCKRRKNVDS